MRVTEVSLPFGVCIITDVSEILIRQLCVVLFSEINNH